jgi:AcrR family transcriptional regulator
MLLGNFAQWDGFAHTGARAQDVDLALFPLDCVEQTVEVVEIGRVAAHAGRIYAAFGDKRALFSLAVKRYLDGRAQYAARALEQPTLEKVIRALFDDTVAFLTTPGHPPTCMTLAGAMGCSVDAAPARDLMTEVRKQNEAAIRERLFQARKSGELSKDINVDDFTRYLSSILAGLSIQAVNGSTKSELKRTAQMALRHLGY